MMKKNYDDDGCATARRMSLASVSLTHRFPNRIDLFFVFFFVRSFVRVSHAKHQTTKLNTFISNNHTSDDKRCERKNIIIFVVWVSPRSWCTQRSHTRPYRNPQQMRTLTLYSFVCVCLCVILVPAVDTWRIKNQLRCHAINIPIWENT